MATTAEYLNALRRDKNNYINVIKNITGYCPEEATFTQATQSLKQNLPAIETDFYSNASYLFRGVNYASSGYWNSIGYPMSPINIVEDTRRLSIINFTSLFYKLH